MQRRCSPFLRVANVLLSKRIWKLVYIDKFKKVWYQTIYNEKVWYKTTYDEIVSYQTNSSEIVRYQTNYIKIGWYQTNSIGK